MKASATGENDSSMINRLMRLVDGSVGHGIGRRGSCPCCDIKICPQASAIRRGSWDKGLMCPCPLGQPLNKRAAKELYTVPGAYAELVRHQKSEVAFYEFVLREYRRNPHSVQWINLMVSVLNFKRRSDSHSPYDAFSPISQN